MRKTLIILLLFLVFPIFVYASELSEILDEQLSNSGIEELQKAFSDIQKGDYSEIVPEFDLEKISKNILKGNWEWDLSLIIKRAFSFYCSEFYATLHILLGLIGVILLCTISENIQKSLGKDGIGDVLFLVCFAIIATIILKAFYIVCETAVSTIFDVGLFMKALFPISLTLLATSGAPASAGVFHPVLITAAEIITHLVEKWLIPLLFVSAAFSFADVINPNFSMNRLASIFKKAVKWSLGIMLTVFTGIISVQSLVTPIIDKITIKTLKYATGNFIPIAGGLLSDTVDLIFSCSSVIKNVVGTVGCITIFVMIAAPCIKMFVYVTVFHIIAALCEPIADSRIVKLLDSVASLCTMLFVITLVVSVMFVISIAIIMGAAVWNT